ncbi:DUF922 domain-containing protein [Pedobacter metabolipauper]|uniref:DUF922 domain-containing protein n=1 Tax=Pedobacter metabolipauper TaxID=425513 RepID=A0A4R6SWT0_9SPHI|nr:hypothetical protein [Pedobacter metabolipauper]TDQ10310.1 hypothetical protein ATK78_2476 [Pedobacter metabolipauper]
MKINPLPLLLSMLFLTPFLASSQHLRPHDIPKVTLADFKASVKPNAPYPVYINVRIYYRIDSVVKLSDLAYKLKVITKVEQNTGGSFFDQVKVPRKEVDALLNHEQGHLLIGFIIGNKIEKLMSEFIYTADFQGEVRYKFQEYERRLSELHNEYDTATNHSTYKDAQKEWDKKLKLMFEQTWQPEK